LIEYLDSSVALRCILNCPERAWLREWFAAEKQRSEFISSRLLQTEVIRALRREGVSLSEADSVLKHVNLLTMWPSTFTQAEAIIPHVKAADALHLATALGTGEPVRIISHDANMLRVAEQLSLKVFDPVAAITTKLA